MGQVTDSIKRMQAMPNPTRNQRLYIGALTHWDAINIEENWLRPDWTERSSSLLAVNDRRWRALTEEEQRQLVEADRA